MHTWLINKWDSFRTGFWFLPTILILTAIALAIVAPEIDARADEFLPEWVKSTGSAARSTLTVLASSLFTVAGVVFSVTVVTLSITASQFGPRLLRNFLEESTTQATMGACLASSIYCLILLWRIDDVGGEWFVPHLAVALAALMTLGSLGMVVFFIHRVAHSIQSMNVVMDVAGDLDSAIHRLFPENIGESKPFQPAADDLLTRFEREAAMPVYAPAEGYLQAINGGTLVRLAKDNDLTIQLACRPGDFLIEGHVAARCIPSHACTESTAKALGRAFLVGNRRTPRQDVECAVNELVEVAVRALSPGINDPFTAVAVIDRLCGAMCRLAKREPASALRFSDDHDSAPRVIARPPSFPSVLNASFDQIRQYGASSVAVSIRLLEALERVARATVRDEDCQAARRQAQLVVEGCHARGFCSGDQEAIDERLALVLAACKAPT